MLKQLLRSVLMLALLAAICTSFSAAQAAPPDLDPFFAGFTTSGKVTETNLAMSFSDANQLGGMALAPDGKVVVVGNNGTKIHVYRYKPNGQRDLGGTSGPVVIPTPPSSPFTPTMWRYRPMGKSSWPDMPQV